MEQEKYGKRIGDMTVKQLESEVHNALAKAIPADAFENMPIGKIEEAHAAALKAIGFFPDIKCKFVCKFVYPPGTVECTLECGFGFGLDGGVRTA
ncbi:hypothetical protein BH10ACI1_BH10ACI1_05330 [soil metagenome]